MAGPLEPAKRETSGGRLKPVADSLGAVGFVSKGDKRLLDPRAQQDYYQKIVAKYLDFCNTHTNDLEAAFASLPSSASGDATKNPPASLPRPAAQTKASSKKTTTSKDAGRPAPSASDELSTLLLSLRKLREGVLATSKTADRTTVSFSQRVHVFSIRFSILARHAPSYFPSLTYLLDELHSRDHPLEESELKEFTTYRILDYACRENDLNAAFEIRGQAKLKVGFQSDIVDQVLLALVHSNWIPYWQVMKEVDGHTRALLGFAADRMRRHALKAVAKAYLSVDVDWIVRGCAGDRDWTWETLAEREGLGWDRESDKIVIRRPRVRAAPQTHGA